MRNDLDQKTICRNKKIELLYGLNKILFNYEKQGLILRVGIFYAFHALHHSYLKTYRNYLKAARPALYVFDSGPKCYMQINIDM